MTIDRRFVLMTALPALLVSFQPGRAADAVAWDGTWNGMLGKHDPWPIAVTIAGGKVVSYTEKGAPFDVQYTRMTPTTLSFGDRDHYSVKLTRTGDATASARVRGRLGTGYAALIRG
ncbi:MAG: hypothetical protein ACLQJL_07415 [Roseiarcus sp.]